MKKFLFVLLLFISAELFSQTEFGILSDVGLVKNHNKNDYPPFTWTFREGIYIDQHITTHFLVKTGVDFYRINVYYTNPDYFDPLPPVFYEYHYNVLEIPFNIAFLPEIKFMKHCKMSVYAGYSYAFNLNSSVSIHKDDNILIFPDPSRNTSKKDFYLFNTGIEFQYNANKSINYCFGIVHKTAYIKDFPNSSSLNSVYLTIGRMRVVKKCKHIRNS